MCAQNCAEIVHTKMCRKCAHTKCAELCTHTKCAKVCAESFAQICHGEVFANVCAEFVSENCVDEKFPVMHIRKFYAREHCPTCVQKVFAMCARRFVQIVHVQNCAQTVPCANVQKWPKMTKMTKIDNLAKMSQNGPKWPKMAENVPGGYMTGHRPPAISYTGWQKLPEYALIRIAAGPKVADLPLCAHVQKSPISAPRPDGKSRRFAHVQKSPLFGVHMCAKSPLFRSTPQNICASCVRTRRHSAHKTFCGTKVFRRAHITLWCLCVRGANVLIRDVHTFCKCAHIPRTCAENTRQGYEHTGRVHSRAPPCTNVHSRNTPCTSAHPCVHLRIMGMCGHQIVSEMIYNFLLLTFYFSLCVLFFLWFYCSI